MRRTLLVCLLPVCLAWQGVASAADTPVTTVANLQFHSAFWINLHHTLYAAAWARRPETGARRLVGPLPAPLRAPLSEEERTAWDAAVDYYDRGIADRDLRSGRGMTQIKVALAAEDLAAEAVGRDLQAVLERVGPIYRRHFWPEHDRPIVHGSRRPATTCARSSGRSSRVMSGYICDHGFRLPFGSTWSGWAARIPRSIPRPMRLFRLPKKR